MLSFSQPERARELLRTAEAERDRRLALYRALAAEAPPASDSPSPPAP
jgi:hypothetical protein